MQLFTGLLFLLPAVVFGVNESISHNHEMTMTKINPSQEEGAMTTIKREEEGNSKAVSYPCKCSDGTCSCCTGNVLQNFNVNMRQRLCTNLTFDFEDTTIGLKVAFNDRVLYQNRLSGKNPPPVCLPIPRLAALKVCIKLTNVYFIGRNVHTCVVLETLWNKETAFALNFDCVRLGRDGVAIVKPEDGGGLPVPAAPPSPDDGIGDYDENNVNPDKPPPGR